jgi:hypothetical protein
MNTRFAAALALLFLLPGCAGMGSCPTTSAEWYRQGYVDGWGTWYSRIEEHTARCGAAGTPDTAAYKKGWDDGRFDEAHKSRGGSS